MLGAGGGVGLAAIGVARALGCRVLGVASTEDKRQAALAAGAEVVLDPGAEPVKDAARAWAGGTGVDIVVDPVGGELAEPSLRALGDSGPLPGHRLRVGDHPARCPSTRCCCATGPCSASTGASGPCATRPSSRPCSTTCWPWWRQGTLDPVRPVEYPLDDVARALEDLLGRRTVGKIALIP